MNYGRFSQDGKEYIINDPVTPRPWINYLTNERYCAIISQCAGGYSFYKDCRSDRLLRWLPESWHYDRPGRYIFFRNIIDGKSWSATYQPMRVKPESYQCRHGLGYTTIESQYNGIRTSITYFVPSGETAELWLVQVSNLSKKKVNLQVFPYIEWMIGDYFFERLYRNLMNLYNRIWYDKKSSAIFAKKTAAWDMLAIKPFSNTLFFSSSLPVKNCATRKNAFLGRYCTEERPEAVLKGIFRKTEFCSGEDGIAAFSHRIDLLPGQIKEFSVILGQKESLAGAKALIGKYRKTEKVKECLETTKKIWMDRITDNVVVKTPDKEFNTMMNIWVKYQMYICNLWSRSPSYYHEGDGGRGYRDSCQDAEGILAVDPEHARKKIYNIVKLIRRDGTSAPGWSDTKGPYQQLPNKDHPVWLTMTVDAYIKETGDRDILFRKAPYLKDHWIKGWTIDQKWKKGPVQDGSGTIYEHLWRNLDFTYRDVGKRGFPRIGHADWNDGIDAAGKEHKGESVWLAQALVRSLYTLAGLAQLAGRSSDRRELLKRAGTMKARLEKSAWDGKWYKRGFTDDGTVYGSRKNREGKIYLNTQSWAVLAGIASGKRLKSLIASVDKYLDGPHGYALFYPAYSKYDPKLGRISMFSEGTKENAAVFCHAATFMVVANCLVGRGDKAFQAMKKIMPCSQKDYEIYKTEPYAYAEYLIGPEHPYLYGEGAFTWITGTAAWTFLAGTEWVLGIRRSFEGLRIDPCIPSRWKYCRIRRPFRNAVYEIEIFNPYRKQKGVSALFVDDKKIKGNLVRSYGDGKVHRIKVILGGKNAGLK